MWDEGFWGEGFWATNFWATEASTPEPDIYEVLYHTGYRTISSAVRATRTTALTVSANRTTGLIEQGERL